jgi:hypothetical protein
VATDLHFYYLGLRLARARNTLDDERRKVLLPRILVPRSLLFSLLFSFLNVHPHSSFQNKIEFRPQGIWNTHSNLDKIWIKSQSQIIGASNNNTA